MNPVVHFEMPAADMERMKKFYSEVFGWQMNQMGPEMGNYVVVTTTEGDQNGRPKMPGAINGGFYKKTDDPGSHAMSVVIAVPDIQKWRDKVVTAGGKIAQEADEIPGVGKWISFIDSEGNRMSMLEPKEMKL